MRYILMIAYTFLQFTFMCSAQEEGFVKLTIENNDGFNKKNRRFTIEKTSVDNEGNETEHLKMIHQKFPGTNEKIKPVLNRNIFEKMNDPGVLTAQNGIKKTPATSVQFYPDLGSVDPMIAAGHNYLIACSGGKFSFYDKTGQLLTEKPGGIKVTWFATDFFDWIIELANKNSFASLKNLPSSFLTSCRDDGNVSTTTQLSQAYDSRIIYEPVHKRFIILSAIRNTLWRGASFPILCNQYATRVFAFAVSKTEDPRDGFHMWYWTKNNYRDWPRVSADKDVLTVAHNAIGDDGTPSIYVISMQDLIDGIATPKWFTYKNNIGLNPAHVIPVANYEKTSSEFYNYVMYMSIDKSPVLYYFKKKADMWDNKPILQKITATVNGNINLGWHERPVLRNGNIYFSSIMSTDAEIENSRPAAYGFVLYRLPLVNAGMLLFGNNESRIEYNVSPPDADGKYFTSYEVPAISVDARGTIMAAYGRFARLTSGDVFPEARYFLLFDKETKHRPSNLLKAGEFMPSFLPYQWKTVAYDGFYNYDGGKATDKYIDYATVVPDPAEPYTFWITHVYANKVNQAFNMVIGKVVAQ
jgi:hypothetical protein